MQNFVIQTMNQFGYFGIVFLIAIENIFPPIPSELILTFGGFMTTCSNLNIIGVIIASSLGSLIGAILLYILGRYFSKEKLVNLCNGKMGKFFHLNPCTIEKSEKWFNNKNEYIVLFGRCIPIVRSIISIPAGMNKMNFVKFFIYTTIGTIIWNTIVVLLGKIAGNSWELILR